MRLMLLLGLKNTLHNKFKLVLILILYTVAATLFLSVIILGIDAYSFIASADVNYEASKYIEVYYDGFSDLSDLDIKKVSSIKEKKALCISHLRKLDVVTDRDKINGDFFGMMVFCPYDMNSLYFVDYFGDERSGMVLPDIIPYGDSYIETADAISEGKIKLNYLGITDFPDVPVIGLYKSSREMSYGGVASVMFISDDYYKKVNDVFEKNDEKIQGSEFIIYADKSDYRNICNVLDSMGFEYGLYENTTDGMKSFVDFHLSNIVGIALVISLMAAFAIIKEISLNLKKREKNIGVMAAYGCSENLINTMIISEMLIYAVAPFPFVLFLSNWLIRFCAGEFFAGIITYSAFDNIGRIILFYVLFLLLICGFCLFRILSKNRKQTPLDILKNN